MTGYKWDPVWRFVPQNGRSSVLVQASAFTDLGGHVKADVKYKLDSEDRDDVNRVLRPLNFGFRPEVRFSYSIFTMEDQANLATIANALIDPAIDVYLSMDGRVTERRVVLVDAPSPKAVRNKTVIGADFELSVRCADLLDVLPNMATDPGYSKEFARNGDFELWSSATDVDAWGESPLGDGSITQYGAGEQRSGTLAVGLESVSNDVYLTQSLTTFRPGATYRLSAWVKAFSGAPQVDIMIYNQAVGATRYYRPMYSSWGTTYGAGAYTYRPTSSYADYTFDFRMDYEPGVTEESTVSMWVVNRNISGSSVAVWDDLSLIGPVLPSGVSTW